MKTILLITFCIASIILTFWLIKKAKIRDIEVEMLCQMIALVPIFNILPMIISLNCINDIRLRKKKALRQQLDNLNKLKECNSCKMIIRNGYIKNYKCPICKKETSFSVYKDEYIPSDKIEEQKEIKDLKIFNKEVLIEKTKEQESIHLKILEERLKDKD